MIFDPLPMAFHTPFVASTSGLSQRLFLISELTQRLGQFRSNSDLESKGHGFQKMVFFFLFSFFFPKHLKLFQKPSKSQADEEAQLRWALEAGGDDGFSAVF